MAQTEFFGGFDVGGLVDTGAGFANAFGADADTVANIQTAGAVTGNLQDVASGDGSNALTNISNSAALIANDVDPEVGAQMQAAAGAA